MSTLSEHFCEKWQISSFWTEYLLKIISENYPKYKTVIDRGYKLCIIGKNVYLCQKISVSESSWYRFPLNENDFLANSNRKKAILFLSFDRNAMGLSPCFKDGEWKCKKKDFSRKICLFKGILPYQLWKQHKIIFFFVLLIKIWLHLEKGYIDFRRKDPSVIGGGERLVED